MNDSPTSPLLLATVGPRQENGEQSLQGVLLPAGATVSVPPGESAQLYRVELLATLVNPEGVGELTVQFPPNLLLSRNADGTCDLVTPQGELRVVSQPPACSSA